MWKFALTAICLVGLAGPAASQGRPAACAAFDGAIVVADDGTYLGRLASQYHHESIYNKHGLHGSKYGVDSIWNQYGMFGGKYSMNSAFNPYTRSPPMVIQDGELIPYLSVNKTITGAVNPIILGNTCFGYEAE